MTDKKSVVVEVESRTSDIPMWAVTVNRLPSFGRLDYAKPDPADVPADVLRALLTFAIEGLALSGIDDAVKIVRDELIGAQPGQVVDWGSNDPVSDPS
ncbi:hypothetical protein SEA_PCORAL7_72 [Gordonia phage PCoral7]|uniref:Uncharacterized protein n=1 Tax=Gordonia phage Toast TaxID=2599852 RepID=A0A5J6TB65_9CAUD|nr:hypothetical protein JZX81_gp72 [Gordonia phage Toast]QFG08131.1 hypothetical protein PBI_TOAST_72 [Gordonia phage Toast]UVF60580.1 hypothetical protein SEA_PCORAL7_72 [Gordonia phage PCoral7]